MSPPLDPYLPGVGDGIAVDEASAAADGGDAWALRLTTDRATAGRVRVEETVGDAVILTVAVDGEATSAEASAQLDADALEGLAATLLDAARAVNGGDA